MTELFQRCQETRRRFIKSRRLKDGAGDLKHQQSPSRAVQRFERSARLPDDADVSRFDRAIGRVPRLDVAILQVTDTEIDRVSRNGIAGVAGRCEQRE